jgi:ADP-ribose pyrophosphatase YjhB (NUDIX family)
MTKASPPPSRGAFNIHRPPLVHCTNCGSRLERIMLPGDARERAVCPACSGIHYENPKLVVGCIPVYEERILLCKRAIEPRYGYWTLPAGFMENGETTAEGAARETEEEAGASVVDLQAFSLLDVPYVHQVHLFYRARLATLEFASGEESLETRLFSEHEIPWDELSFRTVIETLKLFFADRKAGSFGFHTMPIVAPR